MCVCVFFPFILDVRLLVDVPAEVTQEEGHTGLLIHLRSAVLAFIFSSMNNTVVSGTCSVQYSSTVSPTITTHARKIYDAFFWL